VEEADEPDHRVRRPRRHRWLDRRTDWSIKQLVTSLRRYHTIEIPAGDQIVVAADALPNHIRATLQRLHRCE
jgi:hypothetical protein